MKREHITAEEEKALVLRWQRHRDPAACARLIEAHGGLIHAAIRRYRWNATPDEDLYMAAVEGFMHALDKFDVTRGFRLMTYANPWCRVWCAKEARDDRVVRPPPDRMAKSGVLMRRRTYAVSLDELGMTGADDAELTRSGVAVRADIVARTRTEGDDSAGIDERTVHRALEQLKPRTREIMRRRFWGEETLEQIGDDLGFTSEWIRQIEEQALEDMRRVFTRRRRS